MRPLGFCLLLAGLLGPVAGPLLGAAPPVHARVDALGDSLLPRAIARLGTTRFRLDAARQTLALAPDGKTLAVLGTERDQVLLLDAATGRELHRLPARAGDGLSFLPNGKELVCSDSGTITFWGPRDGKELRRVTVKAPGRETTLLSADGWLLATGGRTFGRKTPLTIYEVQTGRQLTSLEPSITQGSAALSPDGQWLATWGSGRSSADGDTRGGPGGRGRGPRDEPTRGSSTVQLWGTATGKALNKIDSGPGEGIAGVVFAPDRKTLALATSGGGLQLWDVASGARLKSWRGAMRASPSRECVLAFSPDGKTIVLGARGGESAPLAWDLTTGRRLSSARAPECRFQGVGFPGPGRIIAFGVQSQAIVVWDLLSGKQLGSDVGHSSAISALTFRADGRQLSTMASDGSVIEWDLTGKEVRRLAGPRGAGPGPGFSRRPSSATAEGRFSPGGAYLASSERFSGMSVRDVQTGQDVFTFSSGFRSGSSFAFSQDGAVLAVSYSDSRRAGARLFRMETGEELPTCDTEAVPPTALAFDPSGRRLAVGLGANESADDGPGEVRVWRTDLEEDDPDFTPFSLPASMGSASSLVFSNDGKLLLVAHTRGIIHLLDAHSGRAIDFLDVNANLTTAPLFSPDGRSVAVASIGEDGTSPTLSLWEMASGKKRWSVRSSAAVTALAFAPNGLVLATGHRDSSGMFWDVSGRLTGRATPLASAGPEQLWAALVGNDAERAFEAQGGLAAGGDDGVPVLRARLRPAAGKPLDAATLARLVTQLDDDDYTLRRKAFAALAEEGKSAEAHLHEALAGKPSAEVKRQARELLARLGRLGASGEQLRELRALEVLEWIGTPAARKLVEELSRGRADAPLTRDAVATLRRMSKK